MRPNRTLATLFIVVAVVQTGAPVVIQKLTQAIVFRHLLHGAIVLCVAVGAGVWLLQVLHRSFSKAALAAFYIGVALLVIFDILIERVIDASA
jgi:hypothetical protein